MIISKGGNATVITIENLWANKTKNHLKRRNGNGRE